MVTQVYHSPDIYSIPVVLPNNALRNLNCYVIKTPQRNLVIDTGFNCPECREALLAGLEELALDMSLTDLFVSHLHSDHTGLAEWFAQQGCTIYMNPVDYNYFCKIQRDEVWPEIENVFVSEGFPAEELQLQLTGNQGRFYSPDGIFPIVPVTDGQVLTLGELKLQCVEVPGHTPGQTVLYLPEQKILFSADHVLFNITPNISIWLGVEGSLQSYLDSLKKVDALEVDVTFPAHRTWEGDLHERVAFLLEHHAQRLQEMYDAVCAHPGTTAFEIAGYVRWSARGLPLAEFPPHQKWFAVGETLAHLYALADEGRLLRRYDGERYRYELPG